MLKILIADDEKYERESLIEIIDENFSSELIVTQVKNGREAIEISEQIRPDIIIMDIKMPGINGIKAIEEIKKTISNAYFIVLTAYDYFDFAAESIKLNVREYILKPYRTNDIIDKLKKAIEKVMEEKEKRKSEIENEEKINNLMVVLENELGYSIIKNNLESTFIETYIKYLDIDFKNTFCLVIDISSEKSIKEEVAEYVVEFLNFRYKAFCTFRHTKEIIYFIKLDKLYLDRNEEVSATINIATRINSEVKRFFKKDIKIGIGNCYNILNNMNKSYLEAMESLNNNTDINHVNTSTDKQISENNKSVLFKNVEKYILKNLMEPLDLESVAAKFNLSPYYFSRSFKDIVGCNFVDYVNLVRIDKAKELLKNNNLSVKEICYTVGYSDPNYFSKVFKKYEGYCPTNYKYKS